MLIFKIFNIVRVLMYIVFVRKCGGVDMEVVVSVMLVIEYVCEKCCWLWIYYYKIEEFN